MLSRLMTERFDLLLLFIQLKHKTALEYVLFMKAIRSTLMMKYFVEEWRNPWLFMTRIMSQWNVVNIDFRISRTTAVRCAIGAKYQRSTIN